MVWLGLATFLILLILALDVHLGLRQLVHLSQIPPLLEKLPKISIIIPALNEGNGIEAALESVLALHYENLEIILIDDRSTDSTLSIMKRLAEKDPRVKIVEVKELPAGWLGKNHALYLGTKMAAGEYFLFTDADVVLEPQTLNRAMNYVLSNGLHHLVVCPTLCVSGFFLELCIGVFTLNFNSYYRPWKIKDPKSKRGLGIGAFNLIQRKAYEESGTHEVIKMRPDDDLKLGQVIKDHGFKQEMLLGKGTVNVRWYHSLREMFHGLEKNAFAGVDYHLSFMVLAVASLFWLFVFPGIAVFITGGLAQLLFGFCLLIYIWVYFDNARYQNLNPFYGVFFPVGGILYILVLANSTWKAVLQRGIYWRGTFYSLRELKQNKI